MGTAFDDVRLPVDIEQGALIGPSFQTTIVPLSGGAEQRNADWQQEKLSADISYGIMSKDDPRDVSNSFAAVMRFYRARLGRWRSFRFRDWSDYQAFDEALTVLGPNHALLTITYDGYKRIITRPLMDTLQITGSPQVELLDGGLLHFPNGGAGGDATFEFDVAMRFDSDLAQVSLTQIDAGEVPSIKLIQVPEPYDLTLIPA